MRWLQYKKSLPHDHFLRVDTYRTAKVWIKCYMHKSYVNELINEQFMHARAKLRQIYAKDKKDVGQKTTHYLLLWFCQLTETDQFNWQAVHNPTQWDTIYEGVDEDTRGERGLTMWQSKLLLQGLSFKAVRDVVRTPSQDEVSSFSQLPSIYTMCRM